MTDNKERFIYRLDAEDVITFVNDDYLRFARQNDAPELTRDNMLGKSVWTFIAGKETRALYRRLFHFLRGHRSEIVVPFRCDSPATVRHMNLTLRSLTFGGIELEGKIAHIETRAPAEIFSHQAERSQESVEVCSLCRRLLVDQEWLEVGSAIARQRLLSVTPVPRLEETVCPSCKGGVQSDLLVFDKLTVGERKK